MRIGLIDVDGHNFPNLALMRISAYHKAKGDTLEWWWSDFIHYDIVYMSKIFSYAYTKDVEEPLNADVVIKGGTGYCISLVDGKEVFDKSKNFSLPDEIEHMFPDYSLYPQYDYAVSMTSRGCPRGCEFCIVGKKEGRCARKVADVSDFWNGQKKIKILDPNILACRDSMELLEQYARTNALCDFTQGIDARILTKEYIEALNACKAKAIHFAWDDMKQSDTVIAGLEKYSRYGKIKDERKKTVYVLTNFGTTMEENLYRVYTLRSMGYEPYVMIYDKPHAPKETKRLQGWVNNRRIFHSCEKFEDYMG